MYLMLFGTLLATAVSADAPPVPWYLQAIQLVPIWLPVAVIIVGFIVWLIAFLAKSLRRTLIFAISAIGALLLITLALKVDAYVLRHRAGSLLADVRSVEVRKTTLAEARRDLQKWQKETLYFETGEDKWRFWISLADGMTSMEGRYMQNESMLGSIRWMKWASRFFGRREVEVAALIDVHRGIVSGKSFTVIVQTPPEDGWNHGLLGTVETVSRFYAEDWVGPGGQIVQTLIHPDYLLDHRRIDLNADTPAYFMGTSAMLVQVTPYADPAVTRHFEDFDLSCVTRWFSCRSVAELMPTAWTEYRQDQSRVLAAVKQLKCTPEKVEAQARNAQAAAVVEVTRNRTDSFGGQNHEVAEVRLVESLRDDEGWKVGEEGEFWVSPWALADTSTNRSLTLPQGKRFILLFLWNRPQSHAPGMWPYPCGVIPWSEENLALVRHGIAEDTRTDEPRVVE
jgi:fumarate reductase subunit D